jgi:hypothetical protein
MAQPVHPGQWPPTCQCPPDGTLYLGAGFGTAPASGTHSFTISINGDSNPADAASGTFTVP